MNYIDIECVNCNPTIFNPDFNSKCIFCINRVVPKSKTTGASEEEHKTVLNRLRDPFSEVL